MADNPMLQYLPPNWTEDTYSNPTKADWESITEDELAKLEQRAAAETKLISEQNTARINAGRSTRSVPLANQGSEESSSTDSARALVELVTSAKLNDFGFLMFRTHYHDEALWVTFLDEYDPILQGGIDRVPKSAGLNSIISKLYMDILSDEFMSDKGPADVAEAFRGFKKDDDIQPGLQTKMCLFVDEECMKSVTERQADTPPFVKAVDVTLGENTTLGYSGFFKVAISSLVAEFYPALAGCEQTSQLCPAADEIWLTKQ